MTGDFLPDPHSGGFLAHPHLLEPVLNNGISRVDYRAWADEWMRPIRERGQIPSISSKLQEHY